MTVLVCWHILGYMTPCLSSFLSDIVNLLGGEVGTCILIGIPWSTLELYSHASCIHWDEEALVLSRSLWGPFLWHTPRECASSQNSFLVGTVSYRNVQFCSGIPIANYDTWQTWWGLSSTIHVRKLVTGHTFLWEASQWKTEKDIFLINKTLILCVFYY